MQLNNHYCPKLRRYLIRMSLMKLSSMIFQEVREQYELAVLLCERDPRND